MANIIQPQVIVVADAKMLARRSAEIIVNYLSTCLEKRDRFTIVLSGGSTPHYLYTLLATETPFKDNIPWDQVHFFWGDERHVPPDHRESNYRMAQDAIFSRVSIPSANIHRVAGEGPNAIKIASAYEDELRCFFNLKMGQVPRFDCILLGMGSDGHTASLFPATTALDDHTHLVMANWVQSHQAYRITFTPTVINNARLVIFLVSGKDKADMLNRVLNTNTSDNGYPAQLIRPSRGKLLWIVDRAAAQDLVLNSAKGEYTDEWAM
jgi:6-phosphogluconolactonase